MNTTNYQTKSIYWINLLWLLSLIVFACDDEAKLVPDANSKIHLSLKFLDLTNNSVSEEISLSSDAAWQIENTTDWVTVTPTKGEAGTNQLLMIDVTENTTSLSRTAKIAVKITNGSASDTLTIRQAGVSPYVAIDWETDATLSHFDLVSGDVAISFKNEVPSFTPGSSAIIIPTDSCHYIRVVNAAETNGNNVTLRTKQGDMSNLFINQEFTLSTVPAESKSALRSGRLNLTDDKGTIHPTRITTWDEEGNEVVIYDAEDPSGLRNMTVQATTNFFYWKKDYTGQYIFKDDGVKVFWDKCLFQAALDGEFYFSFGESTVLNEDLSIEVPTGDLLGFYYLLKGSVNMDLLLHVIAEQNREAEAEEIPVYPNIFGPKGHTFNFRVGNVPVLINIDPSLMSEGFYHSEMRGDLTGGLNAGLEVNVGMNYYKDNGLPKPVGSIGSHFSLYKPAITVKGTIEARVCFYPDISVMFYNFAGPRVQLKPTLGDELRFGGAAGDVDHEYAAWTNRLYRKIEAFGQLNLNFLGKEYSSQMISLIADAKEEDIYRTPEEIEFVTKSTTMNLGETLPVTVRVNDYFLVPTSVPAAVGAVVEFEAINGTVNYTHALTDLEGHATVTFTPTGKDASLTARILDADGKEIASDMFKPILNDLGFDIIGTWRVRYIAESPTPQEIVDDLTLYADGTYKYEYKTINDMGPLVDHIHREITGTYKFREGYETLTEMNDTTKYHPDIIPVQSDEFPYYTVITFTPKSITDNSYSVNNLGEIGPAITGDGWRDLLAEKLLSSGEEYVVALNSPGTTSKIEIQGEIGEYLDFIRIPTGN